MSVDFSERARALAGVVIVGVMGLAACGGSGSSAETAGAQEADTPTTTTTEPPAEEVEDVVAILEERASEVHGIHDRLWKQPEDALDEDNPDVERLYEIHTEDSPVPDELIEGAEDLVEEEAVFTAGEEFRDFAIFEATPEGEDTLGFTYCLSEDLYKVDSAGEPLIDIEVVVQGEGEARRVDGEWLIVNMQTTGDMAESEPGPEACQDLPSA